MLALILAWAHLDGALCLWVARKFGVRDDYVAILLGRADSQAKLSRLQKLYTLEGDQEMAAEIRRMRKAHDKHVTSRNTVAHSSFRGSLKREPDRLIFAVYEVAQLGELSIHAVPIEEMDRSTKWAHRLAERIEKIMAELPPAISPRSDDS
jgi:hypothetical protein